ncbi:MAG: M20/M25/M40 family metallo-hydrolase, partial [Gemmatimonadetes bacterium]|nr:M20/M25/M40 family metallo-hydrolase [Gemmatimonadota bacterium]
SVGAQASDRVVRLTGQDAPRTLIEGGDAAQGAIVALRPLLAAHVLLVYPRGGFGLLDTATGELRNVTGTAPSASADGTHIVFLMTDAGETAIRVMDISSGEAHDAYRTRAPVASPAIAPDRERIAFQMMPREDWEIWVVPAAGGQPVRVTREIQHDLQPRFLTPDTLLALMGEARHRRSYLYDLPVVMAADGAATARGLGADLPGRIRLHHNNTIRTVAPEYEWLPSPDGRRVLIIADRDSDTISPERALVLMDMTRVVGVDALAERLSVSLARERDLRARGERAFEPVQAAVTSAVAEVSTARIYDYANDLFQFDSKFITRPGNRLAIDYIAAQLGSWGYQPELQWFEARGVRTANVIAKLRGAVHPDVIYLASSHFDSVERGPGADDDSSGTTALLEAARVMANRPQAATIHFAFFTGEEAGLLGSREYVRRAVANGDRVVGALNNDMIGFANDHRLDNTIRYSNAGIRDLQHAAAFLFTDLITYDAKYYRSTDAAAYYEAWGDIVGGIGSYPILGNPHYHQPHDVLETINQQLVAEVSKATTATLMLLASSPSRLVDLRLTQGATTAATWTPALESDVREYIVAWGSREDPLREQARVSEPRMTFPARLPAGAIVSVKAVNARGLASWDWARAEVR